MTKCATVMNDNGNDYDLNPKHLFSSASTTASPRQFHLGKQLPNSSSFTNTISSSNSQQQLKSSQSQSQSQCNPTHTMSTISSTTVNTPRKKSSSTQSPAAPFLSFQVENENCAVYVGNIPFDDRTPCKRCCENESESEGNHNSIPRNNTNNNLDAQNDDCCACVIELKAFLRDRINTAFKVPVEKIGIRKFRLFSVVTNVYSNSDVATVDSTTTDNNEGGVEGSSSSSLKSSLKSSIPSSNTTTTTTATTHSTSATPNATNTTTRSGRRRRHRAACVELDDPKIAEYMLSLRFTSFHFKGQPHNRASLRMRRWSTQPSPPPPSGHKSLSPRTSYSPKQRHTTAHAHVHAHAHEFSPPPPRSKSASPKVSNFKRQQQLPPPPRPKSVSPNIIGRKLQQQQYQQQYQTISATTISERASSPVRFSVNADTIGNPTDDPNVKFAAASDGRRSSSPPCSSSSSSSCAIHVGNIPSDATLEDLREFFLERMNKAFHGVTSPKVVRLGMRDGGPRTDAYVEFQEPKVAFRATQLKNRRWHAKKQQPDEITIDEKNPTNNEDRCHDKEDGADGPGSSNSSNNSINYNDDLKKKRGAMPLLEIDIWDPTKYNTSDFFPVNENDDNAVGAKSNDVLGSIFAQAEEKEDDANRSDILEDDIVDATRQRQKVPAKPSPRTSPSLPRKAILAIEEARESGFLICKNPNKTPKCDHIFAIREPPPQGEVDDTSHQIEVKKARMCHGCAFRGKVCTIHKKNQRRDLLLFSPVVCPFAHIYSFDQLEDSHDVLSILYYVENNDEIEFVPGIGCTPQEYLLRQREGQANAIEVGSLPTESTPPNQQSNPSSSLAAPPPLHSQSMEERLRKMCCDLTSVRQELATTQQQLLKSERTRQSLFEQQAIQVVCNATEDASLNKLLLDENDTNIQSLRVEVSRLRNDLQETNQKWEASELAMENNKRDYALLQEKHQHQKVISQLSTERLQLEVVRLKEELQQSQDDYELLKHNKQLSASPTSPTYLEDSWPEGIQLDNFLERSIPSLMQMTNELPLLQSPPKLTDIPLDHLPSCHTPYKPAVDCNPMQPPGSSPTIISKKAVPTDEDSLRSEISYLMSCYGNQVSATNGASTTTVTRFLKLPMTQYNGRDIDVALVLTLPKGYPWNGIVKVDSDPRLSNHFGADLQYRKIVSKSVSGLLNMCRWESEACQGKPHVLIKIMKSAERWVQNDWKIIQKKNWVIQEHSEGSSLLPASS